MASVAPDQRRPHPWLIEPVSDQILLAIARKALGAPAVIREARLLTGGQFNTAYYLETGCPSERMVLRIAPPDDRALFRYERGMMPAEPWIYERLAEAGVPVPRTVALDTSRTILNRAYILQGFVDALPLNHADVPAGARRGLMREAGRCTARIHGIAGDAFGWPVRDGSLRGGPEWSTVFGDLLSETVEEAAACDVIGTDEAGAVLARYDGLRGVFDACGPPVLVHNDIWAPNILVAEEAGAWSVRAIIDADRALFADREFEYILWDDEPLRNDFMAGYGTPLSSSPEANLRRAFYRFYWYLFAAWCYRAQIWRPEAQAACQKIAEVALRQVM